MSATNINETGIKATDVCEEWRVIAGTGSRYSVSSLGRIRSEPGLGGMRRHSGPRRGRILRTGPSANGYARFQVRFSDGTRKLFFVHRCVAHSFIGCQRAGTEVNHKNGVKLDNRLANLEYVTRKGNARHASLAGLMNPKCGTSHYKSKLTSDAVREIRESYPFTKTLGELSQKFGVSKTTICRVSKRGYSNVK